MNNLPPELLQFDENGPEMTIEEEESKEPAVSKDIADSVQADVVKIAKILTKMMEIDWRKKWVIFPLP